MKVPCEPEKRPSRAGNTPSHAVKHVRKRGRRVCLPLEETLLAVNRTDQREEPDPPAMRPSWQATQRGGQPVHRSFEGDERAGSPDESVDQAVKLPLRVRKRSSSSDSFPDQAEERGRPAERSRREAEDRVHQRDERPGEPVERASPADELDGEAERDACQADRCTHRSSWPPCQSEKRVDQAMKPACQRMKQARQADHRKNRTPGPRCSLVSLPESDLIGSRGRVTAFSGSVTPSLPAVTLPSSRVTRLRWLVRARRGVPPP